MGVVESQVDVGFSTGFDRFVSVPRRLLSHQVFIIRQFSWLIHVFTRERILSMLRETHFRDDCCLFHLCSLSIFLNATASSGSIYSHLCDVHGRCEDTYSVSLTLPYQALFLDPLTLTNSPNSVVHGYEL